MQHDWSHGARGSGSVPVTRVLFFTMTSVPQTHGYQHNRRAVVHAKYRTHCTLTRWLPVFLGQLLLERQQVKGVNK